MSPELFHAVTGCNAELSERWSTIVTAAMAAYDITTLMREAAFLAQVGHESGGFVYTTEIWGGTPAQLRYEGRKDLGNTQPGDGKRFRGHGLIQTTGRANHAKARDRLRLKFPSRDIPDFEEFPDLLAKPSWAALSAADFWDMKCLNELADKGDDAFGALTRRINGGLTGFPDRKFRYERAKKALGI